MYYAQTCCSCCQQENGLLRSSVTAASMAAGPCCHKNLGCPHARCCCFVRVLLQCVRPVSQSLSQIQLGLGGSWSCRTALLQHVELHQYGRADWVLRATCRGEGLGARGARDVGTQVGDNALGV